MKIIFATTNPHKREEVSAMVQPKGIEIVGLDQLSHFDDIPEDRDTLEGNALQKAEYIYHKYGEPCFSEDTGLEVMALDGAPGVYTARYGGPEKSAGKNMAKLLEELLGEEDRRAQFRTVICYHGHQNIRYFEGGVTGWISREKKGNGGFGYDPIFIPDGFEDSFAELAHGIKNRISHRAKAWNKLLTAL